MTASNHYKPRKQPTQARSAATYDAILQAAAQILSELGYEATTTNKIAEKAGASIGTLYEYFPTKDAIFAELIRKLDKQMADAVMANFTALTHLTPAQFLEDVLRSRIKAAISYPELDTVLRAKVPAQLFEEQIQNTFDVFSKGMRLFATLNPALIRVRDIDAAIQLGCTVVESTIRNTAANNPERLQDDAFVQEFVDMMLRYILKDESR